MSEPDPHPDDARIEEIAAAWFEAADRGEEVDLEALCGDEPHLLSRVSLVLGRYQHLLGDRMPKAASELPVDRIGDYELKSRIGSGGMGDVFLARDLALDRMVAIKVLRRELTDDPVRRLRFKREAQLTAALDHPNIVPVYATGEADGRVFLVMKHLPGVTLNSVAGTLEARRIAALGALAARALHAAHEVGIVHRDVKPGNVQVDGDEAWVLDFGLARGRVNLTLTAEGQAPGTLAYMPPEQIRGENAIDPRCDVYSLGATLYQCVSGSPPFDSDSPEALVRRALLHDPDPLELATDERDLETLLRRALEKDPGRRFATALEFAEDLERFAAGEPIRTRPPSAMVRAVKMVRRHRAVAASLGAALLVGSVLGIIMWRDASERAVELDRRFEAVAQAIDDGYPATALRRLDEIGVVTSAGRDSRHRKLVRLAQATLYRDALLDRIQLDSVHRQHALIDEFGELFSTLPQSVADAPETKIALAFLALSNEDRGRCGELVDDLAESKACPRVVAGFRALLGGTDLVAGVAGVVAGTLPVEDHVFTAVLLRMVDAPMAAVDLEIDAAIAADVEHPRSRLMLGVQHWFARRSERAIEVFRLLLEEARPQTELHVMIAQVANASGRLALAARHVALADAALAANGRRAHRWLELTRVTQLALAGEREAAAASLADARVRFDDDEWFRLCEVRLLLAQERIEPARALVARVAEEAVVPWNQRRARSTLLQLDVALAGEASGEAPSVEAVEGWIARATVMTALAEAVGDLGTVVEAELVQARLHRVLFEGYGAAGMATLGARHESEAWRGFARILEIDDHHLDALLDAAEFVANQVQEDGFLEDGRAALQMGRRIATVRPAVVAVVREAWLDPPGPEQWLPLAALGAFLSDRVGEVETATEMGSMARARLDELVAAGAVPDPPLTELLDRVRRSLGLDAWPVPPDR